MSKPNEIRSDDGSLFKEGDRAYDYYSMKPGLIGKTTYDEWNGTWFDFHHDDGTQCLLNGQRICTFDHAKRMGWPNA